MMKNDTLKKNIQKQGMKILLVEDNPINQIIVSGILLQLGVSITSAEDGIEAIDLVKKETFDLILMDVQMPRLDGISATRKIREELDNKTPVVAMTAYVTDDEKQKCLEAGMDEFISKPVDKDYLFSILGKYQKPDETNVEQVVYQPEPHYNKIVLNGIEVYDALNRLNCDYEEFSSILHNFCEFYSDIENKLKNMHETWNIDGLKKEAHSIKGAAVNISAINLYLISKEFEEVLHSGNEEAYGYTIDLLVLKFNEVFRSNRDLKEQLEFESNHT